MKNILDFAREPAMEVCSKNRCIIKTVYPENIFTFPDGILGFEDIKEYVFLMNEKIKPFLFMQSLHDSELSFVCIETFLIKPDYAVKLPERTVNILDIKDPKDALVLSLVTVRKNHEEITANLMSPVIINLRNSKAQQVIIEDSKYPVKFNIWDSIEKTSLSSARVG